MTKYNEKKLEIYEAFHNRVNNTLNGDILDYSQKLMEVIIQTALVNIKLETLRDKAEKNPDEVDL